MPAQNEQYDQYNTIKWTDIRNTWPIMSALLLIGAFLWGMKADLRVANVRLENLAEKIDDKGSERDLRITNLEVKVRDLELSGSKDLSK